MKIIISHDVDHITPWEHKKDLIIPKFIVRSFIEFGLRYISLFELRSRFKSLVENKWQNIEELMRFDRENEIPSTFFIGVANGLGLSYSLKDAEFWIRRIQQRGFDVGVHGIAFDDYRCIVREHELFNEVLKSNSFGIRIHYIRLIYNILEFLNRAGYLFDSSLYELKKHPFRVGNLWEFPLHIMDGYIICKKNRWQDQTLEQVKETTKNEIGKAYDRKIKYYTILFHDRYFSDSFRTWKEWYMWLIGYFKDNQVEFISYGDAIKEIETKAEEADPAC